MFPEQLRRLTARVKARNIVNREAIAFYHKMVPVVTPFLGQKVLKVDGSFMAKFYDAVKPVIDEAHKSVHNIFRYSSNYSLLYIVKTVEQDSDRTCCYEDASVYLAEFEGQILKKITAPPSGNYWRTDYTAEEITAKREAYQAAKQIADDALSALNPFGEHDR